MNEKDSDVWKAAALVIEKHGADSVEYAERRAKEALDADDVPGHGIWLAIAEAIRELLRTAGKGDTVN
jgi:hypothetical protein